jgi:hypothetical protein
VMVEKMYLYNLQTYALHSEVFTDNAWKETMLVDFENLMHIGGIFACYFKKEVKWA